MFLLLLEYRAPSPIFGLSGSVPYFFAYFYCYGFSQENFKMAIKSNLTLLPDHNGCIAPSTPAEPERRIEQILNLSKAIWVSIVLLMVAATLPLNALAFEDGYKYLKQLDKNTQIDWTVNKSKGESPCFNDNDMVAQETGLRCKEVIEHTAQGKEIQSTYLKDAQGQVFYAKDLVTSRLVDIGLEYGLRFFKVQSAPSREIFVLVDKNGSFKESFSVFGRINIFGIWTGLSHQKNTSAYAGWLVATGGPLKLSPCAQAILDGLENEYQTNKDYYDNDNYMEGIRAGEFPGNQFMQIELIAMPERATGILPVNIDTAVNGVINEQMVGAMEDAESNNDQVLRSMNSAYYLAFLAVNARSNSMLKELVAQYAEPIGERFITIYQHAAACQ